MSDFSEVRHKALQLPVKDRAALAESLLESLDDLSDTESENLWAEVAQRRLNELRESSAKSISADTVHERAARHYQ